MNTSIIAGPLGALGRELVHGTADSAGFVLNGSDAGLCRSLDKLSAAQASAAPSGGVSIAAHTGHLAFSLSMMNRWAKGENPWADSDWSANWRTNVVDDAEWESVRNNLRHEAEAWIDTLQKEREVNDAEITGLVGSLAHLAYHFGAIRQIDRTTCGPAS